MKINLDLPDGKNLTAGSTALMYQGLQVGTLTKLNLADPQHVTGELTLDPSVTGLMRTNTRIELQNPKLGITDTSLSNLLTGASLQLVPGVVSRNSVLPSIRLMKP